VEMFLIPGKVGLIHSLVWLAGKWPSPFPIPRRKFLKHLICLDTTICGDPFLGVSGTLARHL
jgi:hypothetical protein